MHHIHVEFVLPMVFSANVLVTSCECSFSVPGLGGDTGHGFREGLY